jgi:carboxymethylenebutenolidase
MPIYEPEHVEYATISGRVEIITGSGAPLPAYWAHPDMSGCFPAVALLHDWWGITAVERRLANLFAGTGCYVLIPDLFRGRTASTPAEALQLVSAVSDLAFAYVDTALSALENHRRTNGNVAAVGLGIGGSLAFEAAIKRSDLEAAVACYGFPDRCLGKFADASAPILAIYGANEPHVKRQQIERLRAELSAARAARGLAHEVVVLDGVGREFFTDHSRPEALAAGKIAIARILAFVERFVGMPVRGAGGCADRASGGGAG